MNKCLHLWFALGRSLLIPQSGLSSLLEGSFTHKIPNFTQVHSFSAIPKPSPMSANLFAGRDLTCQFIERRKAFQSAKQALKAYNSQPFASYKHQQHFYQQLSNESDVSLAEFPDQTALASRVQWMELFRSIEQELQQIFNKCNVFCFLSFSLGKILDRMYRQLAIPKVSDQEIAKEYNLCQVQEQQIQNVSFSFC